MHTVTKVAILTLGLAVVGTVTAQAQSSTIQATATVQQPITVSGARDLAFGQVFPGVDKQVAVADANSGRFDVTGQAGAAVNVMFGLPAQLTSVGGDNLLIGGWDANLSPTSAAPTGTSFAPVNGSTTTATLTAGLLSVFLGASVSPTVLQAAGDYSGTVTLTVTY